MYYVAEHFIYYAAENYNQVDESDNESENKAYYAAEQQ